MMATNKYTVFTFTHGFAIGVKSKVVRSFNVSFCTYAQYIQAISLTFSEPKNRKSQRWLIYPSECSPPFCMIVSGEVAATFMTIPIRAQGLSYRPEDWPIVWTFSRVVSDHIASKHNVVFDWRSAPMDWQAIGVRNE